MNTHEFRCAIYEHYSGLDKQAFDDLNYYCFDANGVLRWFSPVHGAGKIDSRNKIIYDHLFEKGFDLIDIRGNIGISVNLKRLFSFSLAVSLSNTTIDYVGGINKAATYLVDNIERHYDFIVEVKSVSASSGSDNDRKNLIVNINAPVPVKLMSLFPDSSDLAKLLSLPIKERLGIKCKSLAI
jgi:hypothetical protein